MDEKRGAAKANWNRGLAQLGLAHRDEPLFRVIEDVMKVGGDRQPGCPARSQPDSHLASQPAPPSQSGGKAGRDTRAREQADV